MSEVITTAGAAGTTEQPSTIPSAEQRVAAAVAAMGPAAGPAPTEAPKPEAPKAEAQPSLADVIRSQREARQAAQAEAQKRTSLESELKAAREELARAKADRQAFEDDPVGYAKARGWSKEQQLMYGQSLLYDLAPDKADPDFRIKMFEDRQKRQEAQKERERAEAETKAKTEQEQALANKFVQDTASAVRDFEAGSYPESESWFGDDYQSYMQSLLATAANVAAKANREGRVADLSAPSLAKVLEADIAGRMTRRDQRKQPQTPTQKPAQPDSGKQPVETMSTKNMSGGTPPTPPATSEKERIQRAVAAGFRTR